MVKEPPPSRRPADRFLDWANDPAANAIPARQPVTKTSKDTPKPH